MQLKKKERNEKKTMSLNFLLVLVLLLLLMNNNNNNNVNGLKCYVCNSCPDSILSILIQSYNIIQECPLGYDTTCVKESYGNAYVTRSCSNETCTTRSAFLGNGRFCCHSDLCNKSNTPNVSFNYYYYYFIFIYSYYFI